MIRFSRKIDGTKLEITNEETRQITLEELNRRIDAVQARLDRLREIKAQFLLQ